MTKKFFISSLLTIGFFLLTGSPTYSACPQITSCSVSGNTCSLSNTTSCWDWDGNCYCFSGGSSCAATSPPSCAAGSTSQAPADPSCCGIGGVTPDPPQPTPLPPCPELSKPELIYTCSDQPGENQAILTWSASTNAEYYSLNIDKFHPSWDGSCEDPDTCANNLPINPRQYTISSVGNEEYKAWVRGRINQNCSGPKESEYDEYIFSCPKGRMQGRRIGAPDRGSAQVEITHSSGNNVATISLPNHYEPPYGSGDILPLNSQYNVSISVPAPGFDVYSSLGYNETQHPESIFCDDFPNQPSYCYLPGNQRNVTIPSSPSIYGVYFADLYWQFIPYVYVNTMSIAASPDAVPAPTAPLYQSGLKSTLGGSGYNNGILLSHQVTITTGAESDLGMSGVAFISNNVNPEGVCIGPENRKFIPMSLLRQLMDQAQGFMIAYVHDPENSPIPLMGQGFYLYDAVYGEWLYGGNDLNYPFGSQNYGIVVKVNGQENLSNSIKEYTSQVDFYVNGDRANRSWKVVGYSQNSGSPNTSDTITASREIVDFCN